MNIDIDALRAGFRRESLCLQFVRPETRAVLDEIIDHERFPGATDPIPLDFLWLLTRAMRPRNVLQLGTLIGYSAIVIADTLAQNGTGHLVTVDPDQSGHELAGIWADRASLSDRIRFVEGYSTDERTALAVADAGPFDLIYLDSSHAYDETRRELNLILSPQGWLAPHGLLVAHDASDFARQYDVANAGGVRRALDEWIDANPSRSHHLILEPPLWQSLPGLAILSRRSGRPSEHQGGARD